MSGEPLSPQLLKDPVHLFALGFGTGLVPKLPGTVGTLAGVLIYYFLQSVGWYYYLIIVVLMFLSGIWLCGESTKRLGVHDHPGIVWDEIVGYLVTMILAPSGWAWIMLGFILFRVFDIWKPWPVRWLDNRVKGGFGIMIDDILAAVYSLLILQLIAYFL